MHVCVMKVFEGADHYFENGFGGLHGDEEFCPALTHEKHKQRLQSRTTEYNLVLTSTTLCLMKGKGTLLMHGLYWDAYFHSAFLWRLLCKDLVPRCCGHYVTE